ncbi:MAG: 16S rRNA (cytosine(967)-C(5))-methyltransferase RsmB, partial [Acutalibacteraceae bacterium]
MPNTEDVPSLSVKYSCPEWIVKSFITDYGLNTAIQLLNHSLSTPPVTLRVNTIKTDTDTLAKMLEQEGINTQKSQLDNSLQILGGIDVSLSESYKKGLFHIQDISSQT